MGAGMCPPRLTKSAQDFLLIQMTGPQSIRTPNSPPTYDLTQGLQSVQQVVEGMSKSEQPTIYIMLKKPSMMV